MNHDLETPRTPKPGELIFVAPRRGKPPRHLADLDRRRASRGRRRARPAGVPRRPGVAATTSPGSRRRRRADRPPGRAARGARRRCCTPTLHDAGARRSPRDDGTTRKTLWRLHDGALVESVLMRYPDRVTMCVSSQAGCGMNCPFCATGQAGLTRNLSHRRDRRAGRRRRARSSPRGEVPGGPGGCSNVVFMGMGEPLANYNAVVGALHRLTDERPARARACRARGITVSTVGLVPRIQQLADGGPAGHARGVAARARRRAARHPRAGQHPLEGRRGARRGVASTPSTTGRRVSIEYALIQDVNDQAWRADLLGQAPARASSCTSTSSRSTRRPGRSGRRRGREDEREFVRRLEADGVAVTVRDTRGQEIDGACGQLAAAE